MEITNQHLDTIINLFVLALILFSFYHGYNTGFSND